MRPRKLLCKRKTDVDDKDDVIRFQMREHAFGSRIHVDI